MMGYLDDKQEINIFVIGILFAFYR